MNNKKKQTVAVAMATALGVSAMMSPVTVHAQADTYSADATKDIQAYESTPLSLTDDTFTDDNAANNAIQAALDAYDAHNATTIEELQDYLTKEFLDTGKLEMLTVSNCTIIKATEDQEGEVKVEYTFKRLNGTEHPSVVAYWWSIPRLPQAGEVAINETNFPDPIFRKYVKDNFDTVSDGVLSLDEISKVTSIEIISNSNLKSLKGIEYFTNLTRLLCYNTGITVLNVSNNSDLQYLDCYNTGIGSLDVSNNTALTTLDCSNTRIGSLNVSNNPDLQYLDCSNTEIGSLNVSNNSALYYLDCSNAGIGSLDVSNNTALRFLNYSNTPLAYLNLGNHLSLYIIGNPSPSLIDFTVTSGSFDMTRAFAGIDISKVTNITGAKLNGNDLTGYQVGTPITYTYDCGKIRDNFIIQKVTLNLSKSNSKIIIGSNLNMEYSGKPYEIPEIKTEGSKGELTFTYSAYINGSYEPIAIAPTNVGKYAVYIELAEDEYHEGAVIKQTFFEITQAKNSWTNELAIKDWKEHEKANKPTATAKFGDAVFTYSASENGVYTSEVPVKAGTWYVRAIVTGTENYAGLEDTKSFLIREAEPIGPNQPDEPTNPDNSGKPNQTTEPDQPMKPENSNDQKTSDIPDKPVEMVETSDTSQSGILAVWSILSGGCIAALLRKKKKSNEA